LGSFYHNGVGVGISLIFGPGIGVIIFSITFFTWIICNIYNSGNLVIPRELNLLIIPDTVDLVILQIFTYKGFDYSRAPDRIAAGFDK